MDKIIGKPTILKNDQGNSILPVTNSGVVLRPNSNKSVEETLVDAVQFKYYDNNDYITEYDSVEKMVYETEKEIKNARDKYKTLGDRIDEIDSFHINLNDKIDEVDISLNMILENNYTNAIILGMIKNDQSKAIDNYNILQGFLNTHGNKIYFPEGEYFIDGRLSMSDVYIKGSGAKIHFIKDGLIYTDSLCSIEGKSHISGIHFFQGDKSNGGFLVTLKNTHDTVIENCIFEITRSENATVNNNTEYDCLDVLSNNINLKISKCKFIQDNFSLHGGVWVREGETNAISKNISFDTCEFYNESSNDEVLAIWGWNGYLENINVTNCTFIQNKRGVYSSTILITLGQGKYDNIKNVLFSNNYIECNNAEDIVIMSKGKYENLDYDSQDIKVINNTFKINNKKSGTTRIISSTNNGMKLEYGFLTDLLVSGNSFYIGKDLSNVYIAEGVREFKNNKIKTYAGCCMRHCKNIKSNEFMFFVDGSDFAFFEHCYNISENDIRFYGENLLRARVFYDSSISKYEESHTILSKNIITTTNENAIYVINRRPLVCNDNILTKIAIQNYDVVTVYHNSLKYDVLGSAQNESKRNIFNNIVDGTLK